MRWAVLAVIGATLMVNGQEPKPHSNADKRNSAAKATDSTDAAASQTVVVVNQQAPQGQEHNRPGQPPSYLRELLVPANLPNLLLVAVGIAGIVAAFLSLRMINRQVAEMRRQVDLTFGQLRAMHEQITEMAVQTGILQESVNVARDAANAALKNATAVINSERPWMILELTPVAGVPKRGYLAFHFWNRGRTPAEVLTYEGNFFYHGIHEPFEDEPTFSPSQLMHRQYISPGNSVQAYGFDAEILDVQKSWEHMRKTQQYIYFWGRIVYRELITYESHESRFCYWLSPAPGVGLLVGGGKNWNKYT